MKNLLFHGFSAASLSIALAGCGAKSASEIAPAPIAPSTTTDAAPRNASTGATDEEFKAAAATWTEIEVAKAALDEIIAKNNLKVVHEAAFKVRDLVRTLPAQSSSLVPDKAKILATQVENVDQLAAKLDEAGDAGNLKDTQENQAGLGDTLDTIRELYPSGTFK